MSFRGERSQRQRQRVDAFAWAAQDVRERLTKKQAPRIVAYVIPPTGRSDAYDHAQRTLNYLRIAVCDAATFSPWVDDVVNQLGHIFPRRMIAG